MVVILMKDLWQSHHETLQYVSKLILQNVKMILKFGNGKGVQFGLDLQQALHEWPPFYLGFNNFPSYYQASL